MTRRYTNPHLPLPLPYREITPEDKVVFTFYCLHSISPQQCHWNVTISLTPTSLLLIALRARFTNASLQLI